MVKKHGTVILRTPPEILTASLKAWDDIAREESEKNPVFKKIYQYCPTRLRLIACNSMYRR